VVAPADIADLSPAALHDRVLTLSAENAEQNRLIAELRRHSKSTERSTVADVLAPFHICYFNSSRTKPFRRTMTGTPSAA